MLLELFVTGFFTGYIPKFPGTCASILTCLVWIIIYSIFNFTLIDMIIFTLMLIPLSAVIIKKYIEKNNIKNDSSHIVIDEIVGQSIALCFIPFDIKFVIFAFILFRLFDIIKPLGIKKLESFSPLYWGIMADDILAGIYAGICLVLLSLVI